ncbi:hypothetical protein E2C01_070614 [Portunus trituberculatus]|uniref:Uncharacterized protein n=1 Tax=Portunus trituberculatus TaxID=210409 RepID=A0A5B7I3Y5_PORTR|nr:hypothetical protein [Portunus trituberculatus]
MKAEGRQAGEGDIDEGGRRPLEGCVLAVPCPPSGVTCLPADGQSVSRSIAWTPSLPPPSTPPQPPQPPPSAPLPASATSCRLSFSRRRRRRHHHRAATPARPVGSVAVSFRERCINE